MLKRSWITHKDIIGGGTLILKMGPDLNKNWGVGNVDDLSHDGISSTNCCQE